MSTRPFITLVMEYCHFLIVENRISGGLFDSLQTWMPDLCVCPMCLYGVHTVQEVSLVSNLPGF